MITFVGTSATELPPTPVAIAPNNAAIGYSDHCSVTVDAAHARFLRPTVDGNGFEFVSPGARCRFATDATNCVVRLRYTNLVTLAGLFNGLGTVLVDGVPAQQFNGPSAAVGDVALSISFGASAMRTVEIVWPYGASVDLLGIDLPAGAAIVAPPARPATRWVAMGDSITHGYYASAEAQAWAWKLGRAKGWQCINHGYGGRSCVPADGTALAALNPTVACYLIGYNDFGAQLALATFKANYTAFVNNFRAGAPTVKLYCITPIYTTSVGALTIEQYRQQIRDALATIGNPLNVLVEGLALMTNSADRLFDGIHPNDLGAAELATSLAEIMTLAGEAGTTMDPSLNPALYTYSDGNRSVARVGATDHALARALTPRSTGKRAYMVRFVSASGEGFIGGLVPASQATGSGNYPGSVATSWGLNFMRSGGLRMYNDAVQLPLDGTPCVVGDVGMVAVDYDAGKIWYGRNGAWYASGDPATGANPAQTFAPGSSLYPAWSDAIPVTSTRAYFDPAFMPHALPAGFVGYP